MKLNEILNEGKGVLSSGLHSVSLDDVNQLFQKYKFVYGVHGACMLVDIPADISKEATNQLLINSFNIPRSHRTAKICWNRIQDTKECILTGEDIYTYYRDIPNGRARFRTKRGFVHIRSLKFLEWVVEIRNWPEYNLVRNDFEDE